MLDSVSLVWGWQRGSVAGRIDNPISGRHADGPDDLDIRGLVLIEEVAARLGADDGQVKSIDYARGLRHYGHWQLGAVDLMLTTSGRVELRASLPKLLLGRNDVVLTATETRFALEILARVARDATGCDLLTLERARLARADYCHQWIVPDVSHVLKALELSWSPPRRAVTTTWAAKGMLGGRSVVWGYGTATVYRWYDKGAERASAGELVPEGLLNRILRYEVQERRPPALESTRVDAYGPDALLLALRSPIERWSITDAPPIASATTERGRLLLLAARAFADHPEFLQAMRNDGSVSRATWYRYGKLAREAAALALDGWRPTIPDDAPERGMAPHRAPELAALYPTLDELHAHEQELSAKRARTLARARAVSDELIRRQTREPSYDELQRFARESRSRRHDLARDELVAEWRRHAAQKARDAFTRVASLEQKEAREQMRLDLGEIVQRAKGALAREIARAGVPAVDGSWRA